MIKEEVIKKFCELSTKVGKEVFNSTVPHDCFCVNSPNFQFSPEIIAFITEAVELRINDLNNKTKRYIVISWDVDTVQTDTLTDDQILDCKADLAEIIDTKEGAEMNRLGYWEPIQKA